MVSLFNIVFFLVSDTKRVVNAARIVLFKSKIKLNNLSSDKKRNFYNWQVDFQLLVIAQVDFQLSAIAQTE